MSDVTVRYTADSLEDIARYFDERARIEESIRSDIKYTQHGATVAGRVWREAAQFVLSSKLARPVPETFRFDQIVNIGALCHAYKMLVKAENFPMRHTSGAQIMLASMRESIAETMGLDPEYVQDWASQ